MKVSLLCTEIKIVLPSGPEHVLFEALRGAVAAAGLPQIRKHADKAQEGKTPHTTTSIQKQMLKLFYGNSYSLLYELFHSFLFSRF